MLGGCSGAAGLRPAVRSGGSRGRGPTYVRGSRGRGGGTRRKRRAGARGGGERPCWERPERPRRRRSRCCCSRAAERDRRLHPRGGPGTGGELARGWGRALSPPPDPTEMPPSSPRNPRSRSGTALSIPPSIPGTPGPGINGPRCPTEHPRDPRCCPRQLWVSQRLSPGSPVLLLEAPRIPPSTPGTPNPGPDSPEHPPEQL